MYWGNCLVTCQPMTYQILTYIFNNIILNARTLTTAGPIVFSEMEPAQSAALWTGSEQWRSSLSAPPSRRWGSCRNISNKSRPPLFRLARPQILPLTDSLILSYPLEGAFEEDRLPPEVLQSAVQNYEDDTDWHALDQWLGLRGYNYF